MLPRRLQMLQNNTKQDTNKTQRLATVRVHATVTLKRNDSRMDRSSRGSRMYLPQWVPCHELDLERIFMN